MSKCKICNTKLSPLNYYYDDDWGHKGNMVWDGFSNKKKRLYYCPECGLVYALISDGEK